ncbi:MAG TPA: hypothetical protein VLK65_17485 [Vicinamibacteria bacterium]|nr:hypothetical protein [Vicinamibacteria bacterium]
MVVLQGKRAGRTSFYLTFITGPRAESGKRIAGVRLQLQRDEELTVYGVGQERQPVFVAVASSSADVRIL